MNKFIQYSSLISVLLFVWSYSAAQYRDPALAKVYKGVILDANSRTPLANVQLSSPEAERSVVTNPKGTFRIKLFSPNAVITAVKEDYFTKQIEMLSRDSIVVYMQLGTATLSPREYSVMDGSRNMDNKNTSALAIDAKDLSQGYANTSDAYTGRFAGLRVLNKGGMPGEGSFLNLHGSRSLLAQNSPLIVVDGIPYLPDQRTSNITNGFSADIFDPINLKEVSKMTLLKGADALQYGSLSSNGVLMIETEKGLVHKTTVEFQTTEGISFLNRSIPVLTGDDYKKYISDIAGSRFQNTEQIVDAFPFLGNTMTPAQKLRYGFNTDWQKEIYTPAFSSDNMLKVRGGDAVVKYMLTAGYQTSNGVVDKTSRNKFYTTGNTDIRFSEKLTAVASVSFSFTEMKLQEQGMIHQTNPMLAAYSRSPLTGLNEIDDNGNMLSALSFVDPIIGISNPVAILSGVDAKNKMYNIMVNTGVNYAISKKFKAFANFGIYYNYIKDDIFIGGKTSNAIAPLLGGVALNTVRSGSSEAKDYYVRAGVGYSGSKLSGHYYDVNAGYQLITSRQEASSGSGINTTSDRYHNLTNVNNMIGRSSGGYAEVWNWMNFYLKGNYNYRHQLFVTLTGVADAASTYGINSARWFVLPGASVGWKINNLAALRNNKSISNLMLRAEYAVNPNSRFSSRYGNYYYVLQMLRNVSSLVRQGIPNGNIGPEKVATTNIGIDFSTYGDKFSISADIFQEQTRNMLVAKYVSSLYGENYMYKNCGEMRSRGIDINASALVAGGAFHWRVGANISTYQSKITSLGGENEQMITLDDGVTIVNRVGEAPFSFLGYRGEGVFSTTAQAEQSDLRTSSGYKIASGDIKFKDVDNNHLIDDRDREILGSSNPKFFGGFYSKMTYKGFSLFANFAYSYGNEIYNGVRRYNESGNSFSNQSQSMARHWVIDGQTTDIPRVVLNDPAGNNRFSSRWIEDGSFIKLKEITLSYEIKHKLLFMNGFKVFITGENLLTFSKYKGLDPEFAYSYDMELVGMDLAKFPIPKTVRVGMVLNF